VENAKTKEVEINNEAEKLKYSIETIEEGQKKTLFFIKDRCSDSTWYGKCLDYKPCHGRCTGKRIVKNINNQLVAEINDLKITKKCDIPYEMHNYAKKKIIVSK
jgi:hypothetical protein